MKDREQALTSCLQATESLPLFEYESIHVHTSKHHHAAQRSYNLYPEGKPFFWKRATQFLLTKH